MTIANLDVLEDPHLVTLGDNTLLMDRALLETSVEPGYVNKGGVVASVDSLVLAYKDG